MRPSLANSLAHNMKRWHDNRWTVHLSCSLAGISEALR